MRRFHKCAYSETRACHVPFPMLGCMDCYEEFDMCACHVPNTIRVRVACLLSGGCAGLLLLCLPGAELCAKMWLFEKGAGLMWGLILFD